MCPYISVVFQKLIVVANVIDTVMLIFLCWSCVVDTMLFVVSAIYDSVVDTVSLV